MLFPPNLDNTNCLIGETVSASVLEKLNSAEVASPYSSVIFSKNLNLIPRRTDFDNPSTLLIFPTIPIFVKASPTFFGVSPPPNCL
jgi:hypothetical protein